MAILDLASSTRRPGCRVPRVGLLLYSSSHARPGTGSAPLPSSGCARSCVRCKQGTKVSMFGHPICWHPVCWQARACAVASYVFAGSFTRPPSFAISRMWRWLRRVPRSTPPCRRRRQRHGRRKTARPARRARQRAGVARPSGCRGRVIPLMAQQWRSQRRRVRTARKLRWSGALATDAPRCAVPAST